MDVCGEIALRRKYGKVRCEIRSNAAASVVEVAQQFDLSAEPDCYSEVDAKLAQAILSRILHRDLAYDAVMMPRPDAEALAASFLSMAASPESRFFSNGDFSQPQASWMPTTTATFDTGILIVGPSQSACLWVEDED